MISEKALVTDGTTTIYSVGFEIISEDHCNVLLDTVLQSSDTYDVINNAVVFHTAPTASQNLMIRVGTTESDLVAAPTDIGIVASNITVVSSLASNMTSLTTVMDNMSAITGVATAASSATTAASSATASENNAASSETNAATSKVLAAQSANTATTKASEAVSSATAAAASAAAAAASADTFDDTYLGAKASAPTVDNDGDALSTGDLYFNTSNNVMMVFDGTSWSPAALSEATVTQKTSVAGSSVLASGSSSQRDAVPADGYTRYNTDTKRLEVNSDSEWKGIARTPTFYGLAMESNASISVTFNAETNNADSYDAWLISEGISFAVNNNNLEVVL